MCGAQTAALRPSLLSSLSQARPARSAAQQRSAPGPKTCCCSLSARSARGPWASQLTRAAFRTQTIAAPQPRPVDFSPSEGVARQNAALHDNREPQADRLRSGSTAGASRRRLLAGAGLAVAVSCGGLGVVGPSEAAAVPSAASDAWESIGGGPADLVFPETFAGRWQVTSTLVSVTLPYGPDYTVDPRVVDRARNEDLNRPVTYGVQFTRNGRGQVVMDRLYNTAELVALYYGREADILRGIRWDMDTPNDLSLTLPGGGMVATRVTRRSEKTLENSRIETSEYFRQTFESASNASSKVKASQCFTKYKWRSAAAAAGGPEIVATQVVSDYLTSFDDEVKFMTTMGKPVTVYTYQMSFMRLPPA